MTKQQITIQALFKDIVPGFLDNRKQDLLSLDAALTSKDFDTICNLGHRMKGSSETYGFKELTVIGRSIEAAAEEKDAEAVAKNVKKMKEYLDNITIVYKE